MKKSIVKFLSLTLLLGGVYSLVPIKTAVAQSSPNAALIQQLMALLKELQAQLEIQLVQDEINSSIPNKIPERRFESGPGKNNFSCDRVGAKLGSGSLACYGLHDYGNEFGEDQNTCGGLDPSYEKKEPTGCVIPAGICSSGRAIASNFYSIRSGLAPTVLERLARDFKTSKLAVSSQLVSLWEYTCTSKPLSSLDSVSIYESPNNAGYNIHQPAIRNLKNVSFLKNANQIVVVGGYSAEDVNGDRIGDVTVSLDGIEADTLLVLSAYESVKWNLTGKDISKVKAVYLTGYNDQFVTGLSSRVPVMSDIYQAGDDGYFIMYNGKGDEDDDFYEFRSYMQSLTGLKTYLYFNTRGLGTVPVTLKG